MGIPNRSSRLRSIIHRSIRTCRTSIRAHRFAETWLQKQWLPKSSGKSGFEAMTSAEFFELCWQPEVVLSYFQIEGEQSALVTATTLLLTRKSKCRPYRLNQAHRFGKSRPTCCRLHACCPSPSRFCWRGLSRCVTAKAWGQRVRVANALRAAGLPIRSPLMLDAVAPTRNTGIRKRRSSGVTRIFS